MCIRDRDHSHYLRQELRLTCTKPIQMKNIIAMQYDLVEGQAGAPSVSGNARGALIVNDLAFTALETPMGINTCLLYTSSSVTITWPITVR